MGRKRRGLFQIDTGRHSPELTAFLRKWLRPGRVPGRPLDDQPVLETSPNRERDAARYRTNARGLWLCSTVVTLAVIVRVWRGHPFDKQLIAFTVGAVVFGVLAVFAWRGGRL